MNHLSITKFPLESFYLTFPFENHNELRELILSEINSQESPELIASDEYYTDNINKLDWFDNLNYDRSWVTIFKPNIDTLFDSVANTIGYQRCEILELWFQQYIEKNTHGWHTHAGNFTGVYYLELPENSPVTELISPFNQSKLIVPDVKEGDIIIFPSYTIHRAPVIKYNLRKTIISFNLNFYDIHPSLLKQLNSF